MSDDYINFDNPAYAKDVNSEEEQVEDFINRELTRNFDDHLYHKEFTGLQLAVMKDDAIVGKNGTLYVLTINGTPYFYDKEYKRNDDYEQVLKRIK